MISFGVAVKSWIILLDTIGRRRSRAFFWAGSRGKFQGNLGRALARRVVALSGGDCLGGAERSLSLSHCPSVPKDWQPVRQPTVFVGSRSGAKAWTKDKGNGRAKRSKSKPPISRGLTLWGLFTF
jgi:hypothetical protein